MLPSLDEGSLAEGWMREEEKFVVVDQDKPGLENTQLVLVQLQQIHYLQYYPKRILKLDVYLNDMKNVRNSFLV